MPCCEVVLALLLLRLPSETPQDGIQLLQLRPSPQSLAWPLLV